MSRTDITQASVKTDSYLVFFYSTVHLKSSVKFKKGEPDSFLTHVVSNNQTYDF